MTTWCAARRLWAVTLLACLTLVLAAAPAAALKPITLTGEQEWLDVINLGETYGGRGDVLQIETAPAADGATARMAVRASHPGTNPNWLVFALHNPTNKAIELWLTADRYSPIGSNIIWPDLDSRRIAAVSHSFGFAPERVKNDRVDIWRLTIERGQTITYAAEIISERIPRTLLWKPIEFEQRQRERQLFNGIMLGITGLLAVFLTAVFAANHKAIFPTAALVAWCALALLCVDFGFWHKLFQMKPEDNAQYRAVAEAAVAASIVIFLAAFLRVTLWHGFARTLFLIWIIAQLAIIGIAILDPRLAATVARLSFGVIGVLGLVLILLLTVRGLDRALALMPTWVLFLVWLFGAALTLTGRLNGDFAISGMVSGLVLILVLIGFTVTQYAFRSTDLVLGSSAGGQQLRLAALDRAGAAFWEWDVRRDEFMVDPQVEASLGLAPGELPTRLENLVAYLHPADRERFKLELAAIREGKGGTLRTGIRVRHADSSYRWLDLEGASVPTSDSRNLRCVGLLRDTTDMKRAQERLLNNAVFDSLTTLPNRELFLDRLGSALVMADTRSPDHQVVVLLVDVDEFRSYNSDYGLVVGDSIILTVSRRLGRIVGSSGTLARIGGDQFAIFLVGPNDPTELAAFAERVRLSLRSSIRIAGQEINLTGSVGIAIYDGTTTNARELLRDAEIAMYRAKRQTSDRAVIFTPVMQPERQERAELERDLARALEQRQLKVLYHPVVALSNDELVGFEAVMRWQHPRLGTLSPTDFLPLATETDLVTRIGSYMLGQTVRGLQRWQQELTRPERPLFAALNISSRQLLSNDLIQEIRHTRSRAVLPAGSLKLAIPETLVMENPEQATHILASLRDAGVDLWLDGFGTGYSSVSYLARFPFESFRLDRALVEWSGQGERDQAVVRSLVAVAHELGRNVIGDGVESAGDATFLRATGCHFAQGFHYGDAMGEDEVLRLLRLIRKSERRMRRRGMVRGPDKRKAAEQPATSPAQATQPSQPTRPTQPPSVASGPQTAPASPPTGRPPGPATAPPSNTQQRPPEPPAPGDRRPPPQPNGATGQPHTAWPPRTGPTGAPSRPTQAKSPVPPARQNLPSNPPANGGGDRPSQPPLPNGQRPVPADQSSQQQAQARLTQPPPVRTQPTGSTPPRPAPQALAGQPPPVTGTRSARVVPGPVAPPREPPPTQANPQDQPPVISGSPPTLTPFPPPQANGGARQGGAKPNEADLSQLSPTVAASLARLAGKGKKPDAAE